MEIFQQTQESVYLDCFAVYSLDGNKFRFSFSNLKTSLCSKLSQDLITEYWVIGWSNCGKLALWGVFLALSVSMSLVPRARLS